MDRELTPRVLGRRIKETEIDRLVVDALRGSEMFASYLFTRAFGEGHRCVRFVRASANVHVDLRGETANPLAYGENDVEAAAEVLTINGRTIHAGLLIENKIDAPLMDRQGHRYGIRGQLRQAAGEWDDFRCVMIAPRARLAQLYPTLGFKAAGWDAVFTFEELASVLFLNAATEEAAQLLMDATLTLNHFNEPILEAVQFWEDYKAYANERHPGVPVHVNSEKGSRAGGVWPSFYDDAFRRSSDAIRKRVQIVHVDNAARVVLFVKRVTADGFKDVVQQLLRPPMKLTKPGGSWQGVMIEVPAVDPRKPLHTQLPAMTLVFDAVELLHSFFLDHEASLRKMMAAEDLGRA